VVTLKVTLCRTISRKKEEVKNSRFYRQNKLLF
jgi:hypothetical protein